VSLARAFVRGLVASLALALGTLLIYGFGAGYFEVLAVPTPLNLAVAPAMLLGLILLLVEVRGPAPLMSSGRVRTAEPRP
jgi:hypothetical protein